MPLTGAMFLGAERRTGRGPAVASVDPRTDTPLEPGYGSGTAEDVARACELAEQAAPGFRATSPSGGRPSWSGSRTVSRRSARS